MDLISIVLTLYNKAPYIEETLFSIYKQTYTNRELIIVDDCSTDGSFEIAKSFCKKIWITEKCKFIQNEKNLRVAKTFERGLREAKGDWISMCDGDDILMKNKLEENLKFCRENHVDFCHSDMITIDENNNFLSSSAMKTFAINVYNHEVSNLISHCCATGSSIFFSGTLGHNLKKDGVFPTMYQDWWCVLYASLQWYKIWYINKALAYYRRCLSCITWHVHEGKVQKTNKDCLKHWITDLKEEQGKMDFILRKQLYSTREQKERLTKHIDLNQQFITFLESNKLLLPFSLLKEIPFVREKIFYYRLFILQLRKILYRFSKIFQKKSDS